MANSPLYREYMKERHRVQSFLSRAKQRGYEFKDNVLPKIPKNVTQKSIEQLKKLTPSKLYEKAKYKTEEGKQIKGTERRQQERKQTAKKAAKTRKERFEEKRRKQDEKEKQKFNTDYDWKEQFFEGNMILERVNQMIDEAGITKPKAAEHLRQVLDDEIAKYGLTDVCRNIANSPYDMIVDASAALHYDPGHPVHESAIKDIQQIITGEVMTMEQAQQAQETIDKDETYDERY